VTGDIDSVYIECAYRIASAFTTPERTIRTVQLVYLGSKVTHEWTYEYMSDEGPYGADGPYAAAESDETEQSDESDASEAEVARPEVVGYDLVQSGSSIPERTISIDIKAPRIYSREDMYVQMRITTLSDDDLSGYSKDELGYMRNEVFARHGHTFKTPKMIKYFGEQAWYKAFVEDATPFLNDIEKKNIEFIKAKEQG